MTDQLDTDTICCASCNGGPYDCWCCHFCGQYPYENCTCVANAAHDQAALDALAVLKKRGINGAMYEKLLTAEVGQ